MLKCRNSSITSLQGVKDDHILGWDSNEIFLQVFQENEK